MEEMSHAQRQFQRYDVSHCEFVGGRVPEADVELRLSSFGLGGCGFYAWSTDPDLIPPKELVCSFFETDGTELTASKFIRANLIYLRPSMETSGVGILYGVKFFGEEREKLRGIVRKLEGLARQGLVTRL